MAIIIFVILFALFAFISGDPSGIEAIIKIVGFVFLFIVLGSIAVFMMDNPIVLVGIIAFVIIVVLIHNSTKSNSSNIHQVSKKNNIDYNKKQNEMTIPTSDFQRELQQNTNSMEQAINNKWLKEQKEIIKTVQLNYKAIKNKLLEKAKNGEYSLLDNCKYINIMYESDYLTRCIGLKSEMLYEKQLFSTIETTRKKFTAYLSNKRGYDFYLSEIKKLAQDDNINIDVILLKDGIIENTNFPFSFITTPSSYAMLRFNLDCTIKY